MLGDPNSIILEEEVVNLQGLQKRTHMDRLHQRKVIKKKQKILNLLHQKCKLLIVLKLKLKLLTMLKKKK